MKEKNKFTYKLLKGILLPIFKWYYKPIIIGKENIPKEGAMLLCGNHMHVMDQCLPMSQTKRIVHYMAKKEYFSKEYDVGHHAWFFKAMGCIPVDRSIKDENAKSEALELLRHGYAVGLFPEGTRNKTDAKLLPFKFGAVSMASKTDALLVPFGIRGKYERKGRVTCVIGKPFKVGDMTLEEANEKLYNEISNLMDEAEKIYKERTKK